MLASKADHVGAGRQGLSPLLQYPAMAIHPPMLYLGYVGFAVPFAFAMGSLITRQPGDSWIHTTRRWTLVTWLFQGTGVMLGRRGRITCSAGAATGVGPGGERFAAALAQRHGVPALGDDAGKEGHDEGLEHGPHRDHVLPLHLGTFDDARRPGAIGARLRAIRYRQVLRHFPGMGIAATIYLILDRLDYLKSESQLESVVSRESSFLFNNLILLASCFAVLWGTLFPKISEAVSGEKIARCRLVQPPDGADRPVPAVPHRRRPAVRLAAHFARSLRRNFQWPGIASLVLVVVLFAAGIHKSMR
jgi:cytochrome c-type biogenesis protein CcmF